MPLTAYVDESMRQRRDDACVYVLAAVIVDDARAESLREQLKRLRSGKNTVLHWRKESPVRQLLIAQTIHDLDVASIVTVCLYNAKDERARRHCLDRLLTELAPHAIGNVTLESRRAHRDKHDHALLTALRRSHRIPLDMAVTWDLAASEPLLWLPDAIAGAVTWWFDGQDEYLKVLGTQVEILDATQS